MAVQTGAVLQAAPPDRPLYGSLRRSYSAELHAGA